MRRAVVAAALLTAPLAACSSPAAPGVALHVSARVDRSAVRSGDTVAVAVVVANPTDRPQSIPAGYCGDPFVVSDAAGAALPQRVIICSLAAAAPRTLPPGEAYTYRGTWRAAVAPGEYTIRGWLRRADRGDGAAAAVTVTP